MCLHGSRLSTTDTLSDHPRQRRLDEVTVSFLYRNQP
jgi:hypothetical protein